MTELSCADGIFIPIILKMVPTVSVVIVPFLSGSNASKPIFNSAKSRIKKKKKKEVVNFKSFERKIYLMIIFFLSSWKITSTHVRFDLC